MIFNGAKRLLAAQGVAHLSVIPMIIYGRPVHYVVAIAVYMATGCLGMSMTYHRLLSHRSWQPPFWFEAVGTWLGTIGLTGSSLAWSSIHRQHHIYADRKGDPHSPHVWPTLAAHYLSMFPTPRLRYAKDLMRNPIHRFAHRRYWLINGMYATLVSIALGPFGLVYAYLFPAALLWNAGSAINTINHLYGYRNHDTKDQSKNNFALGYLAWGEGWHNNHHASPSRAAFGEKWWEFDLGGCAIKLLNRTLPTPIEKNREPGYGTLEANERKATRIVLE